MIRPEDFSEISDIDIALEGIHSAEEFFGIAAEIERMTRFSVDLVEIEKILPEYAALIRKYGHLAYERPGTD